MKEYMKTVVGNNALRARLCEDILQSKLSHAYILEGENGSGRHTLARMTAAALCCEEKQNPSLCLPCMTCPSCRKILRELSPDVTVFGREDKATLGIDVIRRLREDVSIRPCELDHKVYIIENADTMTPQAQNAFLLTLEEPPSYVCFFLLCCDASSLLETVRSRAPVLRTERLREEQIDAYLLQTDSRAAQLKNTNPDEYRELLMAADCGIGKALELLEPRKRAPVLAQRRLAGSFVETVARRASAEELLSLLPRFSAKRESLSEELSKLSLALRDLVALKKSENAPLVFYTKREEALTLCDAIPLRQLLRLADASANAEEALKRNANVRVTLLSLFSDTDLI